MSNTSDQSVLMMAHGSRDREARAEYRRIHEAIAERLAPIQVVFGALEFPRAEDGLPSIDEAWEQCARLGTRQVVALPYFLFPAGHVREDLPTELQAARAAGQWAEIEFVPPLGAADEILETVDTRAQEALATLDGADDSLTAVILVGAGTSDPDANGDLCKAARLVWERGKDQYPMVEAAWVSLTRPSLAEVVERCVKLGATRLAIVPYFLNTGVLLRRIDEQLAAIREAHPGLQAARSAHFGLHPRMLDLIERRVREGLALGLPREGLLSVCGRASCNSVANGRRQLLQVETRA
ncbi:MAG: sirohydrochlorin chelatase [Chloroflexi bacterium]|nr:sirohydrochlorin chelatase [Chloroflexota bacterium]